MQRTRIILLQLQMHYSVMQAILVQMTKRIKEMRRKRENTVAVEVEVEVRVVAEAEVKAGAEAKAEAKAEVEAGVIAVPDLKVVGKVQIIELLKM